MGKSTINGVFSRAMLLTLPEGMFFYFSLANLITFCSASSIFKKNDFGRRKKSWMPTLENGEDLQLKFNIIGPTRSMCFVRRARFTSCFGSSHYGEKWEDFRVCWNRLREPPKTTPVLANSKQRLYTNRRGPSLLVWHTQSIETSSGFRSLPVSTRCTWAVYSFTIWLFHIAMENHHF